jgi:hypothetical protein
MAETSAGGTCDRTRNERPRVTELWGVPRGAVTELLGGLGGVSATALRSLRSPRPWIIRNLSPKLSRGVSHFAKDVSIFRQSASSINSRHARNSHLDCNTSHHASENVVAMFQFFDPVLQEIPLSLGRSGLRRNSLNFRI